MQLSFHRDTPTLTESSPHPRPTTSFCTILKGSKQATLRALMMWIGSSGNGATRTSPSKINSTLCGEDPLGGDFGPGSLLLGCVWRRQDRASVYLGQETRTYFVSPTTPEVRSLLLHKLCS